MSAALLVAAVLAMQTPTPTGDSTAYLDAEARRLVAAARSRRETIDRSITAYQTTMRERIGVGVRALRRDRMLYRRDLALRIEWRRDSLGRIEVLGAREAVPIAVPDPEVPKHVQREVTDYAFDPADDRLTVGFGNQKDRDSTKDRGVAFSHPLAPNSERDYRFATGDSSVVVFPNGRTIRLRELRVIPRRLEFRLMSGSFWIDEDSHAVVRALIRPARAFDFEQDLADGKDDDVPGFIKPIRIEIRFLTVDYGLWSGHWWLPRLMAVDAVATAGSFLQVPVRYERLYADYEVTGDTALRRATRPPVTEESADSATRARCRAQGANVYCRCRNGACRGFVVAVPPDTQLLLGSTYLPPAFGTSGGDSVISAGEMEELMHALGQLPAAPWQFHVRRPRWVLARYNRVEGLSLGARGGLDLGRLQIDGAGRVAFTDAEPDLEADLVRETQNSKFRLAAYHRLAAVDPTARSLAIGNSLGALLLGRDDGDYFRATGAEVTIVPAVTLAQRFSIRLYAERQRRALKRTDFSLPHAFDQQDLFRPNVMADSADQLGAVLAFGAQRGIDPEHTQWSTDVTIDGGTGTYDFGRASTTLRVTAPLGGKLAGAVEIAGGMSVGRVPVQSDWYLGGPGTLRGYGGAASTGDAFWRARLELANAWPAARIVLFGDVGRAGARDHLSLARALAGLGAGASFLDGLVRLDVSRAIRSPVGWRLDFYTDAAL